MFRHPMFAALLLACVGTPARAQHVTPAAPAASLDALARRSLLPQLDYLFGRLVAERRDLTLDGVKALNSGDKFLPGKIAIGFADLVTSTPRTDPRFARYLDGFRQVSDLTLEDPNDTWGIYYYVSALYRLRRAGVLDRAVSPATLGRLRQRLDWRTFVDTTTWKLQGTLPTNYYGVAFSIARLRYLLGWESPAASDVLLQHMVAHYRQYSGSYGFSDETEGEGRFDRYSVLLIGEICQRFIETGMPVTPQLRAWLRNSVDLILPRLNAAGQGFEYGRSIGPYGDSAYLEVLAAAAALGVFTPLERDMAYAFAVRATQRYRDFWYDSAMHSVNMWEHGRRTDAYRNKSRILGENLSLLHQQLYTNAEWNALGYRGRRPTPRFAAWLARRPRTSVTWFARGEYDRALVTFRDRGGRVFSLPLINGGATYHDRSPYFPIPFSQDLVQGVPDASPPQLIPRFILADSTELIPTAWEKGITVDSSSRAIIVRYRQDEMDRVGSRNPVKDGRLRVETTYVLDDGNISRRDTYTPAGPLKVNRMVLEFSSFSDSVSMTGSSARFARGVAHRFDVSGLDRCVATDVSASADYRAPTGQMMTRIRCESENVSVDRPFTIAWRLSYR